MSGIKGADQQVLEALEFYADRRNWRGTLHVMSYTHPVLQDKGKRAREVLKALRGAKCVRDHWHPCYCQKPECKAAREKARRTVNVLKK